MSLTSVPMIGGIVVVIIRQPSKIEHLDMISGCLTLNLITGQIAEKREGLLSLCPY